MSEIIFEDSWATAEETVYLRLIAATQSQDKKNAFLGYLPAMINVWSLSTGPGGGNEQTTWTPTKGTVHVHADIMGVYANRKDAQRFVMACAKIMPISNDGNVTHFRIRIGGWPEPQSDVIELGNEKKRVLVWSVRIGCELVWATGGVSG